MSYYENGEMSPLREHVQVQPERTSKESTFHVCASLKRHQQAHMSGGSVLERAWLSRGNHRGKGPDYGLHTIVDKDPLAPGVTDIVAVHGLNGHYEKTWTDEESQYNWLQESLAGKRTAMKVRVMSFAYNAKVKNSKSTADIFDFAGQLLEGVFAKRDSEEEASRPLVFICHSLGGIIFKQAFNMAKGQTRYQDLAKYTRGVLFFGTPHKGSELAGLGTVLANFLRLSSLGASTNVQLVRDLARNSAKLEQVSDAFLQHGSSLKVITFYELEMMDMMSSLVVEKSSAIMNMRREVTVGLNKNHRNMCKFSSRDDPMLELVLKQLAFVINGHEKKMWQDDKSILLRSLRTSNPELHKSRNPPAVPGTCTWLFGHKSYTRWLEAPLPGLLWLSADPGCGKSVLASFLVDSLRTENMPRQSKHVCFFFFKSDNTEQHRGITALQSILYQVLESQRHLLDIAVKELQHPGDLDSLRSIWRALISVLQEKDAEEVICILDGLDECETSSRRQLTEMLSSNFSPKSTNGFRHTKLRIIITSRPDNALKVAFDRPHLPNPKMSHAPERLMIRLRGEDETDAISHDIGLVVDVEIAEITEIGLPGELLADFRAQLVARADRTFLWVTLIVQLLKERVVAGASRRELQKILNSRDIYAVYSELLSTRPHVAEARKLLSIVLAATRPLTTEELSIALAVEPEFETFDNPRRERRPSGRYTLLDIEDNLVYPFENYIKGLCGNFIRIIKGKVYFVHETAREFLLHDEDNDDDDDEEIPEEPFWLDDDDITLAGTAKAPTISGPEKPALPWQSSFEPSKCHAICLEICVTYLYSLGQALPGRSHENPSPSTAPFLDYAATAWTDHFTRIRSRLDTMHFHYYQNLCHPQFPGFAMWLEIRERDDSVPGGWMKPHGADDDVQDYYVNLFELDPCNGEENWSGNVKAPTRHMLWDVLSSNPGATANHYYPVKTDETGWVSLDLQTDALSNPWVD